MKTSSALLIFILALCFNPSTVYAQIDSPSCKVITPGLSLQYKGACKKGLANGQGDAKGIGHYIGSFKDGMPNGKGTYYYTDSVYYIGDFQNGIKEGQGEMHYIRKGLSDSIVKGYWSGDEYRGKQYITYKTDANNKFDNVDIEPSDDNGNTLHIEIETTSGSPDGTPTNTNGDAGYVLNIVQLISLNGDNPRFITRSASTLKSSVDFELHKFPAELELFFSDGSNINLELYKATDWRVRFYLNR
jgi:hypothetical protein